MVGQFNMCSEELCCKGMTTEPLRPLDKLRMKRANSAEQRKRKRADEAADRAQAAAEAVGCADPEALQVLVAHTIEKGECTLQLLPKAK